MTHAFLAKKFGMEDIVINRIDYDIRNEFERYDKRDNTFKWIFPTLDSIMTHLTSNHYSTPDGLRCDGNCDYKRWLLNEKLTTDVFFSKMSLKQKYDQWYFFGDDFNFVDAKNNFEFLD